MACGAQSPEMYQERMENSSYFLFGKGQHLWSLWLYWDTLQSALLSLEKDTQHYLIFGRTLRVFYFAVLRISLEEGESVKPKGMLLLGTLTYNAAKQL